MSGPGTLKGARNVWREAFPSMSAVFLSAVGLSACLLVCLSAFQGWSRTQRSRMFKDDGQGYAFFASRKAVVASMLKYPIR
jgi:hypothetical protein